METKWMLADKPKAAKVVAGKLVYLRTDLPEFDEDTKNLRNLSVVDLIKANWYAVADCPDPILVDETFKEYFTYYDLNLLDPASGTVTLKTVL